MLYPAELQALPQAREVTLAQRESRCLARTIHEYLLQQLILSPSVAVLLGLLDRLHVRLHRLRVRAVTAGVGPVRLTTIFLNNPR